MGCAYDIRNGFEEYSIAEEMGDKKEAKQRWNDLYENLVYLLAYFRIAGINFESPKFIADVYSALEDLEKDERKRRGEYDNLSNEEKAEINKIVNKMMGRA